MTSFGVASFVTEYTIQPAELARAVDARSFTALGMHEHTHIPASRKTP